MEGVPGGVVEDAEHLGAAVTFGVASEGFLEGEIMG
jgi:hypothetical protein